MKDQSKVSALVANGYYMIAKVDGVRPRYAGLTVKKENATARSTQCYVTHDSSQGDMYDKAVDLLPGTHTVSII